MQDEQRWEAYGMTKVVTVANVSQANDDIADMASHINNEILD
jgi:two-component system chemotaxis response regulator CheB